MPDIVSPAAAPVVEPSAPQAAPQVVPAAATPPVAPPEQGEPQEEQPGALPPTLLKIPAFQALLAGSPAAVSMKLKGSEDRDDVKLLAENKDSIQQSGMGFYRSISGQYGVMFNALKIHPQDLVAADKAGKLLAVAPDWDEVNHHVSKLGAAHPALHVPRHVAALAAPVSAQAPPQAASGMLPLVPPAPAAVARQLAQQRIMNMQAGSPTSGPAPGAGRLTNAIMRPAV